MEVCSVIPHLFNQAPSEPLGLGSGSASTDGRLSMIMLRDRTLCAISGASGLPLNSPCPNHTSPSLTHSDRHTGDFTPYIWKQLPATTRGFQVNGLVNAVPF